MISKKALEVTRKLLHTMPQYGDVIDFIQSREYRLYDEMHPEKDPFRSTDDVGNECADLGV